MLTQSLRRVSMALVTTAALAGLVSLTAREASADLIQNPCIGFPVEIDFSTSGSFVPCGQSTTFSESYDAIELYSYGPGPHAMTATTCLSGNTGDTQLSLYQAAGGTQGAFDPDNPCTNRLTFNDDNCSTSFNLSTISWPSLEQGYYTVVVQRWWSTASLSGTVEVTADAENCVLLPDFDSLPLALIDDPLESICLGKQLIVEAVVENTGVGDLVDFPGQPEYTVTVSGLGCAVALDSLSSSVGAGQTPGAAPLGGSGTADLNIPAGGSDVVRHVVSFPNGIGCLSAIVINRSVWVDLGPPNPGDGILLEDELFTFEDEIAVGELCPPSVFPNNQLGCQVHLPILNFIGQDELCETWIEVQNLGCDFAKASLVTWGEWGFCPPQAAGPLKVECTGLLKPGSTWNLLGAQIPSGSNSGMLFKWTAKQLSEIGVDLGFDDVVADYMCQELFFGIVGDADDYRRFKKAYNEGLEFRGVPMDRATGDGRLAVDVHRKCESDLTPGVEVTSKYNGIAGTHLGLYDPVFGGYTYYVPLIYADKAGFNTIMYIQNGGLECSSVEVWFKTQDDCLRAKICDIATLAPGETYPLDANDCVGPDFQGSAWIRTSQPMGIAVDIVGRDVLMTYVAEPGEINYTFDPTKSITKDGNQVAFGPLIYSEYQGWDTGVQVQNLSAVTAAKVKVYFLDRSGDIITTLVDWICPRGSQTFFLPVIYDLPGTWVGSIRVESQEWITPGAPLVNPPNIVGVVTLIKYNDAARTETTEAIAYNLLPEHKIYDWQIGFGRGGLDSGVGLIAIPSVLKDLDGSGLTSEIAIANVVPKPGFTDFAIYFFDQNGLLDYVCQKLNEKQVEYIDLQTWGYVNPGFKGSAIISATFWEHDVFDDRGNFVRNLVGLGAVAIERNGTRLGEDAPGDEAAGARGIPFSNPRTEEEEEDGFEHCFFADFPICPGTPFSRPDPGSCSDSGVYFDGSPETGAPPETLGGFSMTPFPPDPQPVISNVTSVAAPSPPGGEVVFSIPMSHRRIGNGWGTWSHGYTGDVYYTNGAASMSMTLPDDTAAFYFYTEGNSFAQATFEAVHSDGTTSGPIQIVGASGAKYFGFYSPCGTLESITVTNTDGAASGFAIGEFGIAAQTNN